MPVISIIIPTLGKPEKLLRLLASIRRQKLSVAVDEFEAIVVVNGGRAEEAWVELKTLTAAYSDFLKLIFVTGTGVNVARNAGVQLAQAATILLLDDDCELPEPLFLARHVAFHQEHPAVFATGGGYLLPENVGKFDEVYNFIQMRWFFSGLLQPGLSDKTRYLLGGNFSAKAQMAKDSGLIFDERIAYGGSESEFFRKAEQHSLEVRTNSYDIFHHTHETFLSLARKLFKQGRGKALIDEKYRDEGPQTSALHEAGSNHLLRIFYNYVFWCGYYFYRKEYFGILRHIAKDATGALNGARFRLLSGISRQLTEKKEKGDRF